MTLVERDTELAGLTGLLSAAASNQGAVAVVTGPATTGKTALLAHFIERVAGAARVLTATASTAERDLPLGIVAQLLRPVGPGPSLSYVDSNGPLDPRSMLEVCDAFLALAARDPLVLVVDDIQHADVASVACLLSLLRHGRATSLVMVFADSGHAHTRHPLFGSECARHPRGLAVALTTLSVDGVRLLAVPRLDQRGAADLAAQLHDLTGGNPLLANAAIADVAATGRHGEGFARAVANCLRRGEPTALATARALAVLGPAGTHDRVGRLVDLAPTPLATWLDELTRVGLVRDGQLRHPAVRDAVLRELPTTDAADLHTRAAQLLHEDGAGAAVVAEHLLRGPAPTGTWAVPVLAMAAERAVADTDLVRAGRYLEQAYRWADERCRGPLTAALVDTAWRTDPAGATAHLTALVTAVARNEVSGRPALRLVRQLLWHGRYDEAVSCLRSCAGSLDDDGPAATELEITRLTLATTHPVLLTRAHQPVRPPAEVGEPLTNASVDPRQQALSVLASVLTRGPGRSAATLAEQVLQRARLREHEPEALESVAVALQALLYAERLDLAGDWADRILAEPAVPRTPTWHAQLLAVRAEIALRTGDLPAARQLAEEALRILPVAGWGVAIGLPRATLIAACTSMGAHSEAAEQVKAPVSEPMLQTRYGLHYLHARGQHYLADEQHFAALADFLACGELMQAWGHDQPALVPWRSSAAQAWLRLDNPDQARRLVNEQLARLGPARTRTRAIALRQLAAVSDRTQRATVLTDALEILDGCGDRLELAYALADLGQAQHAMGAHGRARMMARRALRAAQDCHAEPLAMQVRPSGDDPAPAELACGTAGALTVAEHRVAVLAAQGYSNRHISAKLFITMSTVEQHLTRIYRKLGVRRRTDLPAGLYTGAVGQR